MIHDGAIMDRSGVGSTLAEFESFLLLLSCDREAPEGSADSKRLFQSDKLRLGEERLRFSRRLLDEYHRHLCLHILLEGHMNMIFHASVYMFGFSHPIIAYVIDCDAVDIENTYLKLLQRVVAAERFYG